MAAASSILMGLLLSSKTITEPNINRVTRATTQIPWLLNLQNLGRDCPGGRCNDIPIGLVQGSFQNNGKDCSGGRCNDIPIGLVQGSFQNNGKDCPGGRCGVTPINTITGSIHNRNKDCIGGRCEVTPIGLQQGNTHNRNEGCKGGRCNVTPIALLQRHFQNRNKGCPGGWCDVTSNNPVLGTFQNLDRGCPGGHCEVTTEGPTLGGFQGTADPFEDYIVTENTLKHESDSLVTNPVIFSEPSFSEPSFSEPNFSEPSFSEPSFSKPSFSEPNLFTKIGVKNNIQNSFPNSIVATFSPTVGGFTKSLSTSASFAPVGNVVTVPSAPSIAPSRGFVYVDFGEVPNSYDGEGSIRVVSQEIDNSRFQRESTIVDNDYDFWNSINGILGGELGFLSEQSFNQQSNNNNNNNNNINNNNNNNVHQNSAEKFNSNNVAALTEESRDARSFTSFPGESVGVPSRGFITVDFGGNSDDWGPGGFIRVVSHE